MRHLATGVACLRVASVSACDEEFSASISVAPTLLCFSDSKRHAGHIYTRDVGPVIGAAHGSQLMRLCHRHRPPKFADISHEGPGERCENLLEGFTSTAKLRYAWVSTSCPSGHISGMTRRVTGRNELQEADDSIRWYFLYPVCSIHVM